MNNKALTLSLVMAVLAVFFVSSYVSSIEEVERKRYGVMYQVVVAKQDIKEMETINEDMLVTKEIPKSYVEPATIHFDTGTDEKDHAKSLKALVGAIALVPIKKGEQISYSKLSEPGVRTGLAPQITPGRRAVPVPVSDVTGVARLVKPGDRVDVMAILDLGGGKENKIVKTVLQDVVVLATGHNVSNNPARTAETDQTTGKEHFRPLVEDAAFTTITLEVDPAQAQMMALIMANGDNAVSLSLRNNDDTDRISMGSTTYTDVLGADSARVQRAVAGGKR